MSIRFRLQICECAMRDRYLNVIKKRYYGYCNMVKLKLNIIIIHFLLQQEAHFPMIPQRKSTFFWHFLKSKFHVFFIQPILPTFWMAFLSILMSSITWFTILFNLFITYIKHNVREPVVSKFDMPEISTVKCVYAF